MKRLFPILFCLALLGCSSEKDSPKPADLVSEEKMVRILADVHVMESIIEANFSFPDSAVMVYNKRHKEILQKYNVSSDAFYSTYNYYADNLKDMDRLYETVLDTLTSREAKLVASKGGNPEAAPSGAPMSAPAPLIEEEREQRKAPRVNPRARLSRPEEIEQ